MPTLGMGSIRPLARSSRDFLSTIRCRRSIPISWILSTTPSVSAPSTRRDANGMSRIGVFEPQHTHKSGEANAHNFFVEIKQVGRQIAAPFVFFVPERARPWPKAVSGDENGNTFWNRNHYSRTPVVLVAISPWWACFALDFWGCRDEYLYNLRNGQKKNNI